MGPRTALQIQYSQEAQMSQNISFHRPQELYFSMECGLYSNATTSMIRSNNMA